MLRKRRADVDQKRPPTTDRRRQTAVSGQKLLADLRRSVLSTTTKVLKSV